MSETLRGTIEKAVYGGDGLSRIEGKAVFVPYTLPGETVEVRITEDKGSYARAELVSLPEASPERSVPECGLYQQCGGCHWQHTNYAQELKLKEQVLTETLTRAGLRDLPAMETVSAAPAGYRNRIRVAADENGQLGFRLRNSRQVIALDSCPVAAPLLANAVKLIPQFLHEGEELELFCDAEEQQLALTLHTRRFLSSATAQSWFDATQRELPQLRGLALANEHKPARILCGDAELEYRIGARTFAVAAGSFFQANRFMLPRLVKLVTGEATGALAWDLYAGVGVFSLPLAESFEKIVAVEIAQESVASLRKNLTQRGSRALEQETLSFLRSAGRGARPDLVVVDPPRTGLGRPVAEALAKVRAQEIRYLSCDPATLARDLKLLVDSGYCCRKIHFLDLFPRTYHMETLIQLDLR
jgi:23S rRNA (uracil1939-C5)-methyltransferase